MDSKKNLILMLKSKIKNIFRKPQSSKTEINPNKELDYSDFENKIVDITAEFTMTSSERIVSLIRALNYVVNNNINGAIVECGVWKGGSIMAVLHTMNNLKNIRDIYLYDTFEGMTEPKDIDLSVKGDSAKEIYQDSNGNWCFSSLEEVKKNVFSINYPIEKLHFIKGKVEETIPDSNTPDKIAVLRLDTDWYESTKHEMIHLFPNIVKGGIIIIDDYGHWSGCKKAVDEYLKENNIKLFLSRVDYTCRIGVKM
ncbi:TylF/MycF/NovP-related O-methyltransferase [Hwangdonia lutea]|uniref:TylF/MycF/NovP-related O-methyltransferase n=1 Tax=Hwangdonia lutea TaxID=3075823 RepID=A0AA97EPB1_9FLAO|nr:TylF/MycF/NovP-related O-methyltransferase [Hwangdonia sp. SCSIO 19198]WOD43984.1 TylF/MycF/NovP-related O-methyltransferase [Hwangdonia sp. SCSIO 19198]